jgi:DNA-binding response OmpR family regulator
VFTNGLGSLANTFRWVTMVQSAPVGNTAVIETYIFYLRRKLGDCAPATIQTVRGVGYTLRTE